MWGIGIKKEYDIKGEVLDIQSGISTEDSLTKRFLVLFGFKFQIFEKKYKYDMSIRENENKVGY